MSRVVRIEFIAGLAALLVGACGGGKVASIPAVAPVVQPAPEQSMFGDDDASEKPASTPAAATDQPGDATVEAAKPGGAEPADAKPEAAKPGDAKPAEKKPAAKPATKTPATKTPAAKPAAKTPAAKPAAKTPEKK